MSDKWLKLDDFNSQEGADFLVKWGLDAINPDSDKFMKNESNRLGVWNSLVRVQPILYSRIKDTEKDKKKMDENWKELLRWQKSQAEKHNEKEAG